MTNETELEKASEIFARWRKKNDHRKGTYPKELRDLAVELKNEYGSKQASEALAVSPSSLHNWCKAPISQKALPLKTTSNMVMPFVELKHSGKYVASSIEILLPSSISLKISESVSLDFVGTLCQHLLRPN